MLEIKNIHKTFGDAQVLRGVDLKVEKGDVIAILGPSGSGKTTLLRCMNFLETADSGTMEFDGERFELGKMKKRDIARLRLKTGFVFQNYNLFLNKQLRLCFQIYPKLSLVIIRTIITTGIKIYF